MSAFTSRGTPTAATRTSARRHTSARSRVRECAVVTVASSASRSWTSGLPTSFERPTTTASAPFSSTPAVAQQLHHARRRARDERLAALRQQAGADRGEAVDVLERVDQPGHLVAVDLRRHRELEQDAGDLGVLVQASGSARRPRPAASRPGARGGSSACPPSRTPGACCARRPPTRGRRRRGSWRARGPDCRPRPTRPTSCRTCSRTRSETGLPSMTRALMSALQSFFSGA